MALKLTSQRDIDFILYELLQVETFLKFEPFKSLNKKMFDMVIREAKNLAVNEIFPTYIDCDKVGAQFEEGRVRVPPCLKRPHALLVEGEWGALTESPEYGGQGLPHTISQAAMEYLFAANYVLMTYPILSHGAGKMIDLYGTLDQKELFVEKLYSGTWGGSMMLTEPDAGSDVGALTTMAKKNKDGTYDITGNKIFITNGDQDISPNIIHPVLARIEGAPEGTKGISIFIVPKIWVNSDGSLGEDNDVTVIGIEKKMGLHGSPTCSVVLGSQNSCKGLLLGQPGQGMEIMFHMMNEVRLEVGTQAFTSANLAYLYALDYAKQRVQGRSIKDPTSRKNAPVTIIQHPDVKRMLLKMKSHLEGMRCLTYYIAFCFDMVQTSADKKQIQHYSHLVDILTPVVKAYSSEKGFDICVDAMQIFGGYGYTKEYPVEQILRDCKIASIYEGSNGIQAMDFLGRKVFGKKGAIKKALLVEIRTTIIKAQSHDHLAVLGQKLDATLILFESTCDRIVRAMSGQHLESAFACAHPLMDSCGDIVMAWLLLWAATIADEKLDGNEHAFYYGKIKAAQFFITTLIPVTMGKLNAIVCERNPAVEMEESLF